MGVNSLPKTVTRQRRDCDLNPGPSVPESSTLTTWLPSHPQSSGLRNQSIYPAIDVVPMRLIRDEKFISYRRSVRHQTSAGARYQHEHIRPPTSIVDRDATKSRTGVAVVLSVSRLNLWRIHGRGWGRSPLPQEGQENISERKWK